MKVIDNNKLKENSKYILILGLVLIFLVGVEIAFSNNKTNNDKTLSDKEISYNELVINEIMISNDGAYVSPDGNLYDWIEIYNGTNEDIDLFNYGLSDENSGETKWLFPSVTIKSKSYLVVMLSGSNEKGLIANFALSRKGGETITLKSPKGKVIDSVKTIDIEKNSVMARDSNSKWIETKEITPGYSNNKEGRDIFLNSQKSETNELTITEYLPSNEGNIAFNDSFYSYIELQNISDETINLKDYYLSKDEARPFLWRLPDVELKSGDYYIVYANNLDKDNNASFNLDKKTGKIILSKNNKIVENLSYENIEDGFAQVKMDDKFISTISISPGYSNDNNGIEEFNESRTHNKDLIITEVMNQNNKYMPQNGGEYYDWIELYNNSSETINLSDYSITNDDSYKQKYVLPDVKLKPNSYYNLIASGNSKYSNSNYKHVNFKISDSESIYIYKNDKLIDSMFIAQIPNQYSYGKGKSSGLYYFSNPTPKSVNENGILEISYAPSFSIKPGVYDNDESLTLKLDGFGTIYYTLDGSEPNMDSKVYNSPIILNKTTVVRAISYEKGKRRSEIVTGSYIINEDHTMPVMSLSLPDSQFKLISNNPDSTTLTVKAHAELYEKDDSFSIDCGMKLFGGQTRFISKKSFAIKFTADYGPSKLEYKVFDNRDAVKYDTLVIRSGSQDYTGSMFRDELATSIMDDYGTVDVQAYKPVILYINGKYWGIYFLREKVDAEFVSHHYNVPEDGTNIVRIDNNISEGTSSFYRNLVNYVASHDMTTDESYNYVSSKIDIDNFFDYWIGELYTTNNDIVNTRYFNNPSVDNGKIKMIFYDFDYAFYNYDRNYMNWMTAPGGMGDHKYSNTLLVNILKNKKFRTRFLERASYNMKNVWTDKNVLDRYNELYNLLKPEMKRNQERWNKTYASWEEKCKDLKNYINKRRSYMLSSIKSYFGLSDKEMKKYFE